MPSRSYIPTKLTDRQTWFQNFTDYFAINYLALGFTLADVSVVDNGNDTFQNAYTAAQTASTRTPVTIAALVTANNAMAAICRSYAQFIQRNDSTTDAQRSALQIGIPTAPPFGRISAPTTWPVLSVRTIGPLQHSLSYRDSSFPSESKVRAKPFGATSLQLFTHVGATPPADPAASVFLGNFTRLPIILDLDGASLGMTAYYYARWVSNRGLEGPLVGPVSATVANAAS